MRLTIEVAEHTIDQGRISTPKDMALSFTREAHERVESFWVLTLNGAHVPIRKRRITKGLVNKTVAHPREVFRVAILDNACAIILVHNHPSGLLEPSPEDLAITKVLVDSGKLLGISVLDHIIIGRSGAASLVEKGFMS